MNQSNAAHKFPVRARWLVLLWIATYFYLPGFGAVYEYIAFRFADDDPDLYWWDFVYHAYATFLFVLLIIALVSRHSVPLNKFFGPVQQRALWPSFEITGFSFVLSMAFAYITFLPLSYVAPGFIQVWLIDLPPSVVLEESGYPFLPNFFSLVSLCIFAPLIEEVVFRGLLLHRWTAKFGIKKAVLLSSAIFAALHTDPFGAFAFGVLMSYLYVRSKTLWLPILCHSVHNLVVWLLNFIYTLSDGPGYVYSLLDFRAEWPLAVISIIVSAVWWFRIMPRIPNISSWAMPDLTRT